MQIKKVNSLSKKERSEIEYLLADCRRAEGIHLSFPYDDLSSVHLLWENDSSAAGRALSAVLGLIIPQNEDFDEPAECFAFTHPSRRRQGLFTALLDAVEEEIEDYELLFAVDHTSPGALHTLESLGAEEASTEYLMEYNLAETAAAPALFSQSSRLFCLETEEIPGTIRYDFFLRGSVSPETTDEAAFSPTISAEPALSAAVPAEPAFSATGPAEPAALCRTMNFGSRACFYDFVVEERLRGAGLGREAFLLVLDSLRKKHCSGVFLHVTADNLSAVSLYKKTGFRISETLSYYLY